MIAPIPHVIKYGPQQWTNSTDPDVTTGGYPETWGWLDRYDRSDWTEKITESPQPKNISYASSLLHLHSTITTDIVRDATADPKHRGQGTAPQQQSHCCTTELHSYSDRPRWNGVHMHYRTPPCELNDAANRVPGIGKLHSQLPQHWPPPLPLQTKYPPCNHREYTLDWHDNGVDATWWCYLHFQRPNTWILAFFNTPESSTNRMPTAHSSSPLAGFLSLSQYAWQSYSRPRHYRWWWFVSWFDGVLGYEKYRGYFVGVGSFLGAGKLGSHAGLSTEVGISAQRLWRASDEY